MNEARRQQEQKKDGRAGGSSKNPETGAISRDPSLLGATTRRGDINRDGARGGSAAEKERVPLFRGGHEHFIRWEKAFLTTAKQLNIFDALRGDLEIPVADVDKPKQKLEEDGFSADDIDTHLRAWNTLYHAVQAEDDKATILSKNSPAEAWKKLSRKYHHGGSKLGMKQNAVMRLLKTRVNPTENLLLALAQLNDQACLLREIGLDISEELVCVVFIVALPTQYVAFKEMIQEKRGTMTADRLEIELRNYFRELPEQPRASVTDQSSITAVGRRGESEEYRNRGSTPGGDSVGADSTSTGSALPGPTPSGLPLDEFGLKHRIDGSGGDAYQRTTQSITQMNTSTTASSRGAAEVDHSDARKKADEIKQSGDNRGEWREDYDSVTGKKSWYHTGTKKTTTTDPFF